MAGGLTGLGVAEPDHRIVAVFDSQAHELDAAASEDLLVRRQEQPPQDIAGAPPQPEIQLKLSPVLQEQPGVLFVFERPEVDHPFVFGAGLGKAQHPAVHVPELHYEQSPGRREGKPV
jgi:hypothetical protein